MKNKIKWKYLLIVFYGLLFSDIDANFSYELKYGEGNQVTDKENLDYNYFENLLDVNTSYKKIYFYSQLEFSDPPVFGRSRNKLDKVINRYSLEYETDKITLKVGDLDELFGRGLAYYSFVDQNVDYDNLLNGFSINYYLNENIRLSTLWGKNQIDYRQIPTLRESNINLNTSAFVSSIEYENDFFGFINYNYLNQDIILDPIKFKLFEQDVSSKKIFKDLDERFGAGDELVYDAYSKYDDGISLNDTILVQNHNLNWNFYIGNFDIYLDKAWIDYQKVYGDEIFGSRFYSSIYTDFFDIGITYEYKSYSTPYLIKTLENPPIVYRESNSILASRNAHAYNFGNEKGHQIDFNKNLNGVNFAANLSISSRQSEDGIIDYDYLQLLTMEEDSLLALHRPFRQIYSEVNGWLLSEKLYFKLASDYFVEFTDLYHTYAFTLPTQWIYKRNNGTSFTMYLEIQDKLEKQFDKDFNQSSEKKYLNQYISVSFNQKGKWIVTGFFDIQRIDKKSTEYWPGLDLSYNINSTTQLSLFYGSQKGGLVCANGICAEQPGFEDGFKVTLRSIF